MLVGSNKKLQEPSFDRISDHSDVKLAIPYCQSTCQECLSVTCLSMTNLSPLAWVSVCGRFLLFLHKNRAPWTVRLELVMSCFISVHKLQQCILLQNVLSSLLRPGVRQPKQVRLKNLVEVCLNTSCASPWEGYLPSACCQHYLCLLLSALPLSYWNILARKQHPFSSFGKEVLNEGGEWPSQLL